MRTTSILGPRSHTIAALTAQLPTFTWQQKRYASLLGQASPPLVLRVWIDLNLAHKNATYHRHFQALSRLIEIIAEGSPELPHIFAIKVPHFKFGGLSRMLGATLKKARRVDAALKRVSMCSQQLSG